MTTEDFIATARWQTAKSSPHQYTTRRWHEQAGTEAEFVTFAKLIRTDGHEARRGSRSYLYLAIDGFRYWTMGNRISAPGERPVSTILINRATGGNEPSPQLSLEGLA